MRIEECLEKSRFESQGSVVLNGQTIPYRTVSEDNFFVDEEGQPTATIFSYAYFRSDVADPATRPVLFAYNGGPGCSSLWIHAGLFGPRRVKLEDELHLPTVPPFELEDNPHCLLDLCDIVLVDPVGTGFGRLIQEKARAEFYDADGDVKAMAMFIEQWLTRYNRRNSPILLAGESYGTGRSALLAAELLGAGPVKPDTLGLSVSGIMLLGSTFFEANPAEPSAVNLITMAATNHYHHPEGKPDRDAFIAQAFDFAKTEYLSALFQGDALPEAKQAAIAEKLTYFTGIETEFWIRHHLRIDMQKEFAHLLLKDQGLAVGFYDGRYTWKDDPAIRDANVIADDPAMGQYTPAFQTAFALICKELNISFNRSSKGLVFDVNETWQRKSKSSPAQALAGAMRRNPKLRVFFASGLYDLCTTAGNARYLATHSHLDPSRVMIGEYPSGHMAYLGEESAKLLGADMRAFFTQAIGK